MANDSSSISTLDLLHGLGDPDRHDRCLDALFERYYDRVLGWISRKTRDRETARDLTQKSLLSVFRSSRVRSRGNFKTADELEAYLQQVALNTYRNHVREIHAAKRNPHERSLDQLLEEQGREAPELPTPTSRGALGRALDRERMQVVGRALLKLPPAMRECIVLRIHQELTHQEIAERLGVAVGTVKAQLFQARKRLSAELADYFDRTNDEAPSSGKVES